MSGCPYIAGPACPPQDCDGSCWEPRQQQPEPTAEEYCAGTGHPPYAEDDRGVGYCYCGAQQYPAATTPTQEARRG